MRLSEFNFELKYRAGVDNQVADALSRNPIPQELSEEEAASVMYAFQFERIEAELQTWEQRADENAGSTFCVTWGKTSSSECDLVEGFAFARSTDDASEDDEPDGEVGEYDMDKLLAQASDTVTLEEISAEQAIDPYVKQILDSL